MKVAVIGGNGQLGSDVVPAFANGDEVVALTHRDLEVTDPIAVRIALRAVRPDVIVNTAALHDVEACQRDPDRAFAVNALGPRNLALWCRESGSTLVQISTDYVFDGASRTPYVEEDEPRPLNVYGTSKLAGERFVESIAERYFILRTCGLYGAHRCRGKGRNFVQLMLALARERGHVRVVDDEVLSPTCTADLARQIVALVGTESYGLYHATARGGCSWYEFAGAIFELSGVPVELEVAGPGEFPAKVPRPAYSVLENRRLERQQRSVMPAWKDALRRHLEVTARV